MSHTLVFAGGNAERPDGGSAADSQSSGAARQGETRRDHALASHVCSRQATLQKAGTAGKICFAVLDVSDDRRYKVFLRPDDISRLKVSKLRKTLSSASGRPPSSFVLWVGDAPVVGNEDATCAALGITPQTVLRMCPPEAALPRPTEAETRAASDGTRGAKEAASATETSVSRVEKALREMSENVVESPSLLALNQRQRELQARLYEEAKRRHVFATDDAVCGGGRGGEDNNDTRAPLLPTRAGQASCPCNTAPAGIQEERTFSDEGFVVFMNELLNPGAPQQGGSPPPVTSEECCRKMPDERQPPAAAAAAPQHTTRLTSSISCLETVLHDGRLDGMYSREVPAASASVPVASSSSERTKWGDKNKGTNEASPGKTGAAAPTYPAMQGAELEVMQVVEELKDDVNNLLALQVRNETTKRALQRELSSSQRLVKQLEKKAEETRQQLDVFLLQLRDAHATNGVEAFSEAELRVALRNMAASHQNKLLQRENAALEQRLAQEVGKRREMVFALEEMKGHIRVLVRVRPPFRLLRAQRSEMEETKTFSGKSSLDEARVTADEGQNTIAIADARTGSRHFSFYRVFSENSTQAEVFGEVAPLVQLACDGVNVSVLAYGQTGSGKTYTILGGEGQQPTAALATTDDSVGETDKHADDDGIVPRALRMLFQHLRVEAATEAAIVPHENDRYHDEVGAASMYEVSCSLLELYNDKVQDLLAPPQVVVPAFHFGSSNASEQRGPAQVTPRCALKIGADGRMYVVGLTQHVVREAREALLLLREGASRRQVHATQQNPSSSRSHLIFTVYLTQKRRTIVRKDTASNRASSIAFKQLESKLVFVDLAGSERIAKSQSVGDRLLEARYINKSLAALGDVVATLSNAATANTTAAHVPYRNSALTSLLQDVIGNRSKTLLLACVGPSDPPYENHTAETVTTLQFASRVRCVRNVAPPFPSTGATGGGAPSRGSGMPNVELDVSHPRTASSSGRGATKLWMRPTQSSRQRAGAVVRPSAVATNEADCDEEDTCTQPPAPLQPLRGNDPHAEQLPRMRF
ncbi:kinesin-14 [Trypanosoma conorhini]|uniref:Kinesin-14 n=1 Tax=Trypanosoma conorhini TaxID=83891 RepID=A0A3R7N6V1_9TRYP|nr:kinesin-14 [Trypanosoma conorhini]RNF17194.1 kinesin-14 [Trypanosoma conorhini]